MIAVNASGPKMQGDIRVLDQLELFRHGCMHFILHRVDAVKNVNFADYSVRVAPVGSPLGTPAPTAKDGVLAGNLTRGTCTAG